MPSAKAADLLKRLSSCPVNYDPTVDHSAPNAPIHKIAFVPQSLCEELKVFLRQLP